MLVANISDSQSVIQRNKTKDRVEKTSSATQANTNSTHVSKSKPTTMSKPKLDAVGYDITFSCNVPSAYLYIDGNANGQASGTRFLRIGSHSIKVIASGYDDYTGNISVNQQNTSCNIFLNKKQEIIMPTTGNLNGHDWVDLGLSVKWATCNVGASIPSDVGDYYAWGETISKSHYAWDNCFNCEKPKKYQKDSSWGVYKLDGKTSIIPSSGHDAARENWGSTWRMPTNAETAELCKKCKWTWTTSNGHNGYIVTGPNGNCIFLPASIYEKGSLASIGSDKGGNYWSSSLSPYFTYKACGLYVNIKQYIVDVYDRMSNLNVRPVTD